MSGATGASCREGRLEASPGGARGQGLAQDPTVGSSWGPLSWCSLRERSGKRGRGGAVPRGPHRRLSSWEPSSYRAVADWCGVFRSKSPVSQQWCCFGPELTCGAFPLAALPSTGPFQPGVGRLSVLKSGVCTQCFCLSLRLGGPCATCDRVHLSPNQFGGAPGRGGAWAQGCSRVVPRAGFQPVDQGLLSGEGTRGACFTLIFISYCLTNLHDKIGVFQK